MLACARIGAIHSVVFGGFSAQSVADRILDCQAKMVITSDGGFRRGAIVPLKKNVDDALLIKDASGKSLTSNDRKGDGRPPRQQRNLDAGRSRSLVAREEIAHVDANCPAEKMDSEAPLFILYTSGSTGKPKGILHTTAGYLLGAKMIEQIRFRFARH